MTIDQAIQCLEAELGRSESEKKRLDADDGLPELSGNATPVLSTTGDSGQELQLDYLDFSGPSTANSNHDNAGSKYPTEPMPLHVVATGATHENSDSCLMTLSFTGPSRLQELQLGRRWADSDVPIRRKAR